MYRMILHLVQPSYRRPTKYNKGCYVKKKKKGKTLLWQLLQFVANTCPDPHQCTHTHFPPSPVSLIVHEKKQLEVKLSL